MLFYSIPDIFNHLLLLPRSDSFIEILRIRCRHQNNATYLKLVHCEVWVVPDTHVTIFVETYHCVLDAEGTQASVELMKTHKRLAKDVKSLLMCEITGVDESIWYVFGENGDVFMVGAEVRSSFVICSVSLDDRFFSAKTIIVSL